MLIEQCYVVLELPAGASMAEVKVAYRDLAQVWHPDRFTHSPRLRTRAEEKMKMINEAYNSLQRHHSGTPHPRMSTARTPSSNPYSNASSATSASNSTASNSTSSNSTSSNSTSSNSTSPNSTSSNSTSSDSTASSSAASNSASSSATASSPRPGPSSSEASTYSAAPQSSTYSAASATATASPDSANGAASARTTAAPEEGPAARPTATRPPREDSNARSAASMFQEAQQRFEAGEFREATTLLERVTRLERDHPKAHYWLGLAYLERDDIPMAEEAFRNALRCCAGDVDAFCSIGHMLCRIENYDEAITSYGKAIQLEPDNRVAHLGMVNACEAQGTEHGHQYAGYLFVDYLTIHDKLEAHGSTSSAAVWQWRSIYTGNVMEMPGEEGMREGMREGTKAGTKAGMREGTANHVRATQKFYAAFDRSFDQWKVAPTWAALGDVADQQGLPELAMNAYAISLLLEPDAPGPMEALRSIVVANGFDTDIRGLREQCLAAQTRYRLQQVLLSDEARWLRVRLQDTSDYASDSSC